MNRPAFCLDLSRCTGCATCVVACLDRRDLPPHVRPRRVEERVDPGPPLRVTYLSLACHHCGEAPCVDACPTGAMDKGGDGVVRIDPEQCIGCRACMQACPFGAPQYDPGLDKAVKCDYCRDESDADSRPACVDACPTRALHCGDYDELVERFGPGLASDLIPAHAPAMPNLLLIRSDPKRSP